MAKKYTLHVISGTHWDREWRHTAEQSKLRLADLMDNIIKILEEKPEYNFFCVDGGTIVLEDYFNVRPENRERVTRLIKSGKMQIVKWYTLPETNTFAPEALIRNLLLGKEMAEEFGGGIKSGYTATSYGQHSQMPQLYKGFGIDTAIFYRGTNKFKPQTPLFTWEGIDGTTLDTLRTFDEVTRTNWFFYVHGPAVLGKGLRDLSYTYDRNQIPVHMADLRSYEKAFVLLKENKDFIHDPIVLKRSLDALITQAMPYKIGNHILALNMEDNDEPYYYLPELIAEMNKVSDDIEIIQDTLDSYMKAIIKDTTREKSAFHKGELRYTTSEHGNFNALLSATHSSRIKIKLYNNAVETDLINTAEPLASVAYMAGAEYPKTMLDGAWRSLLKNHAHDSICGAAVDRAHEDMMYNFSVSQTVAEEVSNRASVDIFRNTDTSMFKENDETLSLFNTLPFTRKEIIPLVLDLPKRDAKSSEAGIPGESSGGAGEFYDIVDSKGKKLPMHVISNDESNIGVEREMDTKAIKFKAKRSRVLVEAEIPAFGTASFAIRPRGPVYENNPETMAQNRKLIARENGVLENEFLKVTLGNDGTYSMLHKASGRLMENLGYFIDTGEVGSAHISEKPKRNHVVLSRGASAYITMLQSNELRGIFKIETEINVPVAATVDGTERLRETKKIPLVYTLTLEKGSPMLKVNLKLRNECRDHKLTINFPSGLSSAEYVYNESAWAVEKRPIKHSDHKDNFEQFPACRPMQNFVDVTDGKNGLAVLTRGLREYEIDDDDCRTIKLTLLRTQRAYMTANAAMITEELDKYTGQHSFGDIEYDFALYPHIGTWDEGRVLQAAYEFKSPIKAIQGVPYKGGSLPATGSYITITPSEKIMLSGVKLANNGQGIIVRVWNTTNKELPFKLSTILPFKSVCRVKLDESFIEDIACSKKSFEFKLGAHKIETFLLKK